MTDEEHDYWQALGAADAAKEQGLRGYYPRAVIVLAVEVKRLRSALAELVALNDMKNRGFGSHDTDAEDDYLRRKPQAWAAARAALAHGAAPVTPNVKWTNL